MRVKTRRFRHLYDTSSVVRMPAGEETTVARFIRYHVLIRVYDGDADAWLAELAARGRRDGAEVRFARWIRSRLRQDPTLLSAIQQMVESTPFWLP